MSGAGSGPIALIAYDTNDNSTISASDPSLINRWTLQSSEIDYFLVYFLAWDQLRADTTHDLGKKVVARKKIDAEIRRCGL